MSSLLERAIVDADALRTAALKNAETMVVEKYSQEIKEAMNNILEQEFAAPMTADPLGLGGDDLTSAGETDFGLDTDLGLDMPMDQPTTEVDPQGDDISDTVLADIPDAFDPDLDDDEGQIIRIRLDSLHAELGDDSETDEPGEISIDISDDDNAFEGEIDNEVDNNDDEIDIDITSDMISEVIDSLDIDLEDIDLDIDDILEAVRVDFEPQKSGWAGTPEPIMREYEKMLLAKQNDTETKEENEELKKALENLKTENQTLTSAASKLNEQNKEYLEIFGTLQKKLESVNISNAKLLYINRALENASLNERQKRKIVEAISKAETVEQAKIVYETLNESIPSSYQPDRKFENLSEAVSRRSSLLVSARSEQKEMAANPMYDRLQKLAGINIK